MKTCASLLSLLPSLLVVHAGCPAWAEDAIVTGPDRRHEIDLRIEALDARRAAISTTGPMATTLIGLGVMVAGAAMLGAGMAACNDTREFADECGGPGSGIGLAGAGGGLLVIGAAPALIGGIIWGVRADRRYKIDAERKSLMEERDGITAALSRLELRSPHRDGTQFVTLGLRF